MTTEHDRSTAVATAYLQRTLEQTPFEPPTSEERLALFTYASRQIASSEVNQRILGVAALGHVAIDSISQAAYELWEKIAYDDEISIQEAFTQARAAAGNRDDAGSYLFGLLRRFIWEVGTTPIDPKPERRKGKKGRHLWIVE